MVTKRSSIAFFFLTAVLGAGVVVAQDAPVRRPDRGEVRAQLRRSALSSAPEAENPAAFEVRYALSQDAALSVTLLDLARLPLRTFHVASGEPGARAGENVLAVWDGKDSRGFEAPAGDYWVGLSFRYSDGTVETKRFRIEKR